MSQCGHDPLMIQALADGELDSAHTAATEALVRDCPVCASHYAQLVAIRAAVRTGVPRLAAPERLRRAISVGLAPEPTRPAAMGARRPSAWAWLGAGAALAFAASISLVVVGGLYRPDQVLTHDLVASHVRSLQLAHLTDIETSDHHVVKPWFSGKLDYSPPVIELKDQGFPLVGGRLDYVGGRTVAAIVYRRGRHLINLFVWPAPDTAEPPPPPNQDGYALRHWRAGGMTYWALSDVNGADLSLFEDELKARLAAGG